MQDTRYVRLSERDLAALPGGGVYRFEAATRVITPVPQYPSSEQALSFHEVAVVPGQGAWWVPVAPFADLPSVWLEHGGVRGAGPEAARSAHDRLVRPTRLFWWVPDGALPGVARLVPNPISGASPDRAPRAAAPSPGNGETPARPTPPPPPPPRDDEELTPTGTLRDVVGAFLPAEQEDVTAEPGEPAGGPVERMRAFFRERLAVGVEDHTGRVAPGLRWSTRSRARSDVLAEYRRRVRAHAPSSDVPGELGEPARPGVSNFTPLGPAVMLNDLVPFSGRAMSIATSADGGRVYVGAANGGVFRSDDGGVTWRATMNAFDLRPTSATSDSLAVGAIAVSPVNPDRVYVGTGEAFGWGPDKTPGGSEYFGVGPVITDDGGRTWSPEPVAAAPVTMSAFFALAVDPLDPERVVGAAREGILRREPRNEAVTTFDPPSYRPQSYFLRYNAAAGAVALHYWDAEGWTSGDAWVKGADSWSKALSLQPLTLDRLPFLLQYDGADGEIEVLFLSGDQKLQIMDLNTKDQFYLDVGKGLTLATFLLEGTTYLLRYKAETGGTELDSLALSYVQLIHAPTLVTVKQVWRKTWTAGFTSLMPFVLDGAPYLLCYNSATGAAELLRWTADVSTVAVWSNTALGAGWTALVPVQIAGAPYFLLYNTGSGAAQLNRWTAGGAYSRVWARTLATGLAFMPFQFDTESRLLGYNAATGAAELSRFDPAGSVTPLWLRPWATGLSLVPMTMGHHWVLVPPHQITPTPPNPTWVTSVVASRSRDGRVFYAAFWDGQVYASADGGESWAGVGAKFPSNAGRISLAVQAANPDVVYALVGKGNGTVYRLDRRESDPPWRAIDDGPKYLTGGAPEKDSPPYGEGDQSFYDLAIAVAPDDVNRIYVGGSSFNSNNHWRAGLYRCEVKVSVGVFKTTVNMTSTFIGNSVHSDVQAIVFVPGDASRLWIACDGGAFYSTDPLGAGVNHLFAARNNGLSTATVNAIAQHPTEDAVLFAGMQDNGNQRYLGDEAWQVVRGGDGGVPLVNTAVPKQVLAPYTRWDVRRSKTYGNDGTFRDDVSVPESQRKKGELVMFYPPLAASPTRPERVAFGSQRPWINDKFAEDPANWRSLPNNDDTDILGTTEQFRIRSITFYQDSRLYVGILGGSIYRYDYDAGKARWTVTDIDNLPNGFLVPVTCIAVDPADGTGASIYVTFGGTISDANGGFRRVWRYDGTRKKWEARSGPSAGSIHSLLNVQYNTLVFDGASNTTLYVGADIGVWRSTDGGVTWAPFAFGLPETAVVDLKYFPANLHPGSPALLRAATYGRGVYEMVLSSSAPYTHPVMLYVRDTVLDRGLYPTVDGLPSPTEHNVVSYLDAPDIKARNQETLGQFGDGSEITFTRFALMKDQSLGLLHQETARVYVQIHNRGPATADGVSVWILLSKTSSNPPPALPATYLASVQGGAFIDDVNWMTLAIVTVDGVAAGSPRVVSADIPADAMPLRAQPYYLMVILSQADDPFTTNDVNVMSLSLADRKVATKQLLPFLGRV